MIAFSGIVRRRPPGVNLFFISYSEKNGLPGGPVGLQGRAGAAAGLVSVKPAIRISIRSSRVSV